MQYIVVALSVDQGVPASCGEIFQDEREADGMFAGICGECDLEEFPVARGAPEKGLLRWATDGVYYSVSMYSREIIV